MHRIDGAGAAPGGYFTAGDPNVGVPATVVTPEWLNAVQAELEGVATSGGAALSKPDNGQVLKAIRALIAAALPAGAVAHFARSAAPSGWLECDGSTVSRAAYPALFAAIGTTFGSGDGATTFALPDARGEFLRGWDHGRGVDGGRALGSPQADQLAAHTHPIATSTTDAGSDGYVADASSPNVHSASTGSTGGTETRPRNLALMVCIKT